MTPVNTESERGDSAPRPPSVSPSTTNLETPAELMVTASLWQGTLYFQKILLISSSQPQTLLYTFSPSKLSPIVSIYVLLQLCHVNFLRLALLSTFWSWDKKKLNFDDINCGWIFFPLLLGFSIFRLSPPTSNNSWILLLLLCTG